jgi:NAD-dependent dihydropyrimidine dehydrogenase PreA subunit
MSRICQCQNPKCGKSFVNDRGAKYCSDKCRQQAYRLRHGKPLDRTRGQYVMKCVNCGKCFVTSQPYARFHSVSCRVSFWQQQKRLAAKEELLP